MKRLTYLYLVGLLLVSAAPAQADIFQWEYINPGNPGLGKQPSTTLCVSGEGMNAVPGTDLSSRNLAMAYLIGADLNGASAEYAYLPNADLTQANLSNSHFYWADLTMANLGQAILTNANLAVATLGGTNLTGAILILVHHPAVPRYRPPCPNQALCCSSALVWSRWLPRAAHDRRREEVRGTTNS